MSSISIKLYKNSILSLLSNNTNNILENDAKCSVTIDVKQKI